MKLFFADDRALVEVAANKYLCIGSKVEAEKANDSRIVEMVHEAIAMNKFLGIETQPYTIH